MLSAARPWNSPRPSPSNTPDTRRLPPLPFSPIGHTSREILPLQLFSCCPSLIPWHHPCAVRQSRLCNVLPKLPAFLYTEGTASSDHETGVIGTRGETSFTNRESSQPPQPGRGR